MMSKDMAATDLLFLQSFSLDFAPWAALKKKMSITSWHHLCVGLGREEPVNTRRGSFHPTMLQIDKLREVFSKYDKDGDGKITNVEFATLMKPSGQAQQGHYSIFRGRIDKAGFDLNIS